MSATYYKTDDNGYFVSETTAFESPLEPGKILTPRNAFPDAPPTIPAGHVAKRSGGSWVLIEDMRGTPYWIGDVGYIWSEIEGPLPEGHSLTPPEPEPEPEPDPEPELTPEEQLALERLAMRPFATAFRLAMLAVEPRDPQKSHLQQEVREAIEALRGIDPDHVDVVWYDTVTQIVRAHPDMTRFGANFGLSALKIDALCRVALAIDNSEDTTALVAAFNAIDYEPAP